MFSLDPFLKVYPQQIQISWREENSRISESELHRRLAQNQASNVPSIIDSLENLDPFERRLLLGIRMEYEGVSERLNFLSLKRNTHTLRYESLSFVDVPSYHVIVEIVRLPRSVASSRSELSKEIIIEPSRKRSPSTEQAPMRKETVVIEERRRQPGRSFEEEDFTLEAAESIDENDYADDYHDHGALSEDEGLQDVAAVDEVLRKYTTIFEAGEANDSPSFKPNQAASSDP